MPLLVRRMPLALALVVAFAAGCSEHPAANAPQAPSGGTALTPPLLRTDTIRPDAGSKDPLRVETPLGDAQSASPALAFKIENVARNRRPIDEAPYHREGGDWTFFDCRAVEAPDVAFTVGVMWKPSGDDSFAWGKAKLLFADRAAVDKFLAHFAAKFPGKVPPATGRSVALAPLEIPVSVLGTGMRRDPSGGFVGTGGDWTATKWFPTFDDREAEIYFNFNLAAGEGEFSEKDLDYRDALSLIWAAAFRDGRRPERTPATDPRLTNVAPSIGIPRRLTDKATTHYAFSPNGRSAVYEDDGKIFALPLDVADAARREITRFEGPLRDFRVVGDDGDLLVEEGIGKAADRADFDGPTNFWWVDGKTGKKTLLAGPEKNRDLATPAVSPDLRYVAFEQWRDIPGSLERTLVVILLDRSTAKSRALELSDRSLSLVGWKQAAAGPEAELVTNRWNFDETKPTELYRVDSASGTLVKEKTVTQAELAALPSPDGKHRAQIEDQTLVVVDVASGARRTFVFHDDDHDYVGEDCLEWAGPRYLKFNGRRLALIDITLMKMCYPKTADGSKDDPYAWKFSPDFRWVFYPGGGDEKKSLLLAPVTMPQ